MSRTDKDKPLHARAVWWRPSHWRCEYATSSRWRNYWQDKPCNLPAGPDPASYDKTAKFGGLGCTWEPEWDRRRYGRGSVPAWFTTMVFHDPQRRQVREFGRRAIAEHRATGEVTAIEPDGRARHSAGWDYW